MSRNNFLSKLMFLPLGMVGVISLTSCGGIKTPDLPVLTIDDNYRTMYEIFPISFADSNGDGDGDLQGIIDKIDYIKDLGFNGVWLTPIHPSPTYHMYDVDDYYDINPTLGTLEDYDALVTKLHENDMTILLDLVLNHSSSSNPWFKTCYEAHIKGMTNNQYYEYYNIQEFTGSVVPSGFARVPGSNTLIYECRFWSGMPDFNLEAVLNNPDGPLATEIKNIMKFWLVDHNVDGFRLDAVTSYFTGSTTQNAEFLEWLMDEAQKIKEDVYIVGEGAWGNPEENKTYISAGINSCFNFEDSQSGGYIGSSVVRSRMSNYHLGLEKNLEQVKDLSWGVPAPFISNHDTSRLTGAVAASDGSEDGATNIKMAYGLLQMMSGATFNYYGDEIGMAIVSNPTSESVGDENRRQPLYWGEDDSYMCDPVSGTYSGATNEKKYPYGSVSSQLEDENSILNFVKKANEVRNQHLAISHGVLGDIYGENDLRSAIYFNKTYNDEDILIVINGSLNSEYTVDFGTLGYQEVVGVLDASSTKSSLSGTVLTSAPMSIIVIR